MAARDVSEYSHRRTGGAESVRRGLMLSKNRHMKYVPLVTVGVALMLAAVFGRPAALATAADGTDAIPTFQYDPAWPKTLPNNWLTGQIAAMAIDSKDHVWVVQ